MTAFQNMNGNSNPSDMKGSSSYSSMLNFNVDETQFYSHLFDSSGTNLNQNSSRQQQDNNVNCLSMFGQPFGNDTLDSSAFNIFSDAHSQQNQQQNGPSSNANYGNYENLNALSNSISETLLLQDLNIPSGLESFASQNQVGTSSGASQQPSYRRHAKKPSGAALFGFHGRELSIPGMKPIDLMEIANVPAKETPKQKKSHNIIDPKAISLSKDYIITNNKPSSYKFPPDPEPASPLQMKQHQRQQQGQQKQPQMQQQPQQSQQMATFFSQEYLQKMSKLVNQKPEVNSFSSAAAAYASDNVNLSPQQPAYPESIDELLELTVVADNTLAENYVLGNERCFPTPMSTAHSSPVKRPVNVNSLTLQVPAPFNQSQKITTPELKSESAYPNMYMTPSPKYSTFNNGNSSAKVHGPVPQTASSGATFSSPEEYCYPHTATPSPYHGGSPVKVHHDHSHPHPQGTLNWENMMTIKENTVLPPTSSTPAPQVIYQDHSSPHIMNPHQSALQKKKGCDKVSTLPPGYIDQFIIGPDENKRYYCNYNNCGKVFQRRYNIRSHIQTHLCDRPYKCSFDNCNKSFVRQHDLHRHEKIHENNKFSCLCGKGFTRYDALRRHTERNICVGGIETEASINKPKKKRGRPKKIPDNEKLSEKLEQAVETTFNKEKPNQQAHPSRPQLPDLDDGDVAEDDDLLAFEANKENSFVDSPSGKSSAPLTPISANGTSKRALPLSSRLL